MFTMAIQKTWASRGKVAAGALALLLTTSIVSAAEEPKAKRSWAFWKTPAATAADTPVGTSAAASPVTPKADRVKPPTIPKTAEVVPQKKPVSDEPTAGLRSIFRNPFAKSAKPKESSPDDQASAETRELAAGMSRPDKNDKRPPVTPPYTPGKPGVGDRNRDIAKQDRSADPQPSQATPGGSRPGPSAVGATAKRPGGTVGATEKPDQPVGARAATPPSTTSFAAAKRDRDEQEMDDADEEDEDADDDVPFARSNTTPAAVTAVQKPTPIRLTEVFLPQDRKAAAAPPTPTKPRQVAKTSVATTQPSISAADSGWPVTDPSPKSELPLAAATGPTADGQSDVPVWARDTSSPGNASSGSTIADTQKANEIAPDRESPVAAKAVPRAERSAPGLVALGQLRITKDRKFTPSFAERIRSSVGEFGSNEAAPMSAETAAFLAETQVPEGADDSLAQYAERRPQQRAVPSQPGLMESATIIGADCDESIEVALRSRETGIAEFTQNLGRAALSDLSHFGTNVVGAAEPSEYLVTVNPALATPPKSLSSSDHAPEVVWKQDPRMGDSSESTPQTLSARQVQVAEHLKGLLSGKPREGATGIGKTNVAGSHSGNQDSIAPSPPAFDRSGIQLTGLSKPEIPAPLPSFVVPADSPLLEVPGSKRIAHSEPVLSASQIVAPPPPAGLSDDSGLPSNRLWDRIRTRAPSLGVLLAAGLIALGLGLIWATNHAPAAPTGSKPPKSVE